MPFFKKRIIKGLFFNGFVFIVALFGCTTKNVDERTTELKIIVAKYNNALIEAYKNQHFEPLKEVAVEEEVKKVNITVSSYLQSNQIMEAEIHRIDFKDIKVEENKATIVTSEDWSYRWIDYRTKEEIEPLTDIRYEMHYSLVKKDGRWMVEKVEEDKTS